MGWCHFGSSLSEESSKKWSCHTKQEGPATLKEREQPQSLPAQIPVYLAMAILHLLLFSFKAFSYFCSTTICYPIFMILFRLI